MNFLGVITKRHSCRSFTNQPVEDSQMEYIYNAVQSAPSAGGLQAYTYVLVTDDAKKDTLAMLARGQLFIKEAPVVLVFFALPILSAGQYGARGSDLYSIQDATIACTYAQLAATDLGLASCWVGAFDEYEVRKYLKAEWSWKPIAILPIGYPAKTDLTSPRKYDRMMRYDSSINDWRSRQR